MIVDTRFFAQYWRDITCYYYIFCIVSAALLNAILNLEVKIIPKHFVWRVDTCVFFFYNTTGDSLQPGTSPVGEISCPDSPVAKKRTNALFQPGT